MPPDILQYFWIFPIYSFLGWVLEVVYCSVDTGKFVNRGFLNGASCPIYGIGAVVADLFLAPMQGNLFVLYFGSVIVGSMIELVGGFLLKKLFHMSWWDYCDQPMNIGGYICLKYSLGWGVVGIVFMRIIHPIVHDVITIIPTIQLCIMLIVFYSFFIADLIITALAVLKLGRDLREVTRLSNLLNKGSERMAEGIGNTALHTAGRIKELDLAEKTREIKERIHMASEDNRAKIHEMLESLERLNTLLNNRSAVRRRLFKAFPRLRGIHDNSSVQEMKRRM